MQRQTNRLPQVCLMLIKFLSTISLIHILIKKYCLAFLAENPFLLEAGHLPTAFFWYKVIVLLAVKNNYSES